MLPFEVLEQAKLICGKINQYIGFSGARMAIGKRLKIFWEGGNVLSLQEYKLERDKCL